MNDEDSLFAGLETLLVDILPTDFEARKKAIDKINSCYVKISTHFQSLLTKLETGLHTKEILEEFYELGISENQIEHIPEDSEKWMSIKEIREAGSTLSQVSINKRLIENKDLFQTKKDGKRWIAYVDEDNYSILNLPDKFFRKEIVINIHSKDSTFYPNHNYSRDEVKKILSWVHCGIFKNENVIDNVFNKIGKDRKIKGSNLIDFINEVNGMMLLGSEKTQEEIQSVCGRSYDEIVHIWDIREFADYVHSMPDIFPGTFLKKSELGELCEKIKKFGYADNEIGDELNKAHQRLVLKRIMPRGKSYSRLLGAGILKNNSIEDIQRTYTRFEEAMEGFAFFDFNALRIEMDVNWNDFNKGPMKKLVESGLARDILSYFGVDNNRSFYVIARGKKDKVYEVLDL